MKASEILTQARELLSDEKRWNQGYYALNESKAHREAEDVDAVCFCSLGALAKVAGRTTGNYVNSGPDVDYLVKAVKGRHASDVVIFNDSHDHAEVIEAFDKAIELAQKDGN